MFPGSAGAASHTGVKCSVRPMPPRFRQHPPRRADFAVEMARERQRAALAQTPRALFDNGAGQLRHPRRRRARARRERKDMQMRQAAFVDEVERRSNIASVSVGKPAIRSAPNTVSGRSRRTCRRTQWRRRGDAAASCA